MVGFSEDAPSSRQNSIDMEESTDIAETRAKRKLWPVVEVAVILCYNFLLVVKLNIIF